ncbi:type IV pilin protein [Chromobacterium amazonense]|uniref:Type IV pilin protein n=1 Tax=Chromobacterium amazonense TaxID=1382803 RepID=A0A1S1XCJ5_9NEIS|nr:type IV pilin protein [Chromobacterium amazonense]MBM2884409.1 type IV pilin protein [Chromobacterium amazonense]MDE1711259.1 type IV pilin protein [Chromobacterium amazonense]MDQ4539357.1 type IV pilin protein [Chromobacterium amazonense]OHX17733.1 hypothetical protein BI343_10840 [Chromobacterium amazonense]PRP70162.1 hypothetical protein BUE93_13055 [Chromobacterium amazonense]
MRHPQKQKGFSLIELVIAMAVLAILVGVAVPAYTSFIQQSNRSAAKTALQDLATRQESYYTLNNTYASQLTALNYASGTVYVPGGGNNLYALAISSATASSFTLTATPQGNQAKDTSCQTFQLDNQGNQLNIIGSGTAQFISGCW